MTDSTHPVESSLGHRRRESTLLADLLAVAEEYVSAAVSQLKNKSGRSTRRATGLYLRERKHGQGQKCQKSRRPLVAQALVHYQLLALHGKQIFFS